MNGRDALSLSLAELARSYRRHEVSPVEVTAAALERTEELDGRLHSFITVTAGPAMQQAEAAEHELAAGVDRGPLQGVPLALKDLYATKGIRTTAHSRVMMDWSPDEDATVTARLAAAGAVLLGKLARHEFAWGAAGFDTPFPPACNPWNIECIPGGSSSGSGVAVAARLCFGAMGSDTGGSIRMPAHLCGITGLKTTYGLVSRHGVIPLAWSLDTCGPMARSAEDCALMLQAVAGYDPRDAASAQTPIPDYAAALARPLGRLRVGVPRSWIEEGEGPNAEILAAFEQALGRLRDLGAEVVDVDGAVFSDARAPHLIVMMAEAYAYHEASLKLRPQDYGALVRERLYEVAQTSAADYIQAQRARDAVVRRARVLFEQVDVVATPSGPKPAEPFADTAAMPPARFSYSGAFNLIGGPAISVPCGFTAAGLPIGLQLAGRNFDETTVLSLAHAYQQTTDWHTAAPPIVTAEA